MFTGQFAFWTPLCISKLNTENLSPGGEVKRLRVVD